MFVFPLLQTGESQYCAFLLLKALQTMARTYEDKRGQRAIRADPNNPVRGDHCQLKSLTLSLSKFVINPPITNINNCHGSCASGGSHNNHAVLLNSYIENERAVSGGVDEWAPCCVPVAYENTDLVILDTEGTGTELTSLNDVVAKECGCR